MTWGGAVSRTGSRTTSAGFWTRSAQKKHHQQTAIWVATGPAVQPGSARHDDEVIVTLARRSFSPVLPQAAIPTVSVPSWNGRKLVFRHP